MTQLVGKTPEQIREAVAKRQPAELVEMICSLATVQPMFSAADIARRTCVSVKAVRRDMNDGKFVDPVLGPGFFCRGENSKKVTAGAVNAWLQKSWVSVRPRE